MGENSQYIIYGPKLKYKIWYQSLTKYLFDCLNSRKSSDVIAIDAFTKKTLTCGELLDKSIKLSTALKKLSIKKGDVSAVISENSLECYIAACASLHCGAQLNVINAMYTPVELKHAFDITKPKIVFSSKTALPNVLSVKEDFDCIRSIILMETDSTLNVPSIEDLIESVTSILDFEPVNADLSDTVIMCLSSGTTGLPKCVEITHQNIIPTMNCANEKYFNITSKDTSILILPFFHIYGLVVHFFAITHSLKAIVMKSFKPDLYLEAIEEYKATKLFIVPPILVFLVKSPIVAKFNLTSLEDIVVGAAPLSNDIYEEALRKFAHCTIRQLYGMTETAGPCTIQDRLDKFITIGKLPDNMTAKVISCETNAILGPYEKGELCFKSLSIMKGYLNNPTETQNSIDSDGFYHTGDVGYYDTNENFYVVDRIKELIKYKGFQVGPAEIENILLSHPGIKDCGVVGIKDLKYGELPLAFVTRQPGSDVTEEEIIKFVAGKISIHKQLHGGVRFLNEIPRTSSGKMLRRELMKLCKNITN